MSLTLLPGNNEVMKAKCTVHIDNKTESFDDFITLGFNKKDGNVHVLHNCDVLTISVGMEILAQTMTDMYNMMPQNERDIVDNYFAKEAQYEQNRNCNIKPITSESSGDDAIPGTPDPTRTQH